MALRLVVPPAAEPVTTELVKAWTKIEQNAEDSLLEGLMIPAIRAAAENFTERSLMLQTWELVLDAFPASAVELRRPPIQSIVSIKYIDRETRTEVQMDPSGYSLDKDSEPGWVMPAYGTDWPDTLDTPNAVRIRFIAGYTTVPPDIKAWIAMHVATLYANRETVNIGNVINELPFVLDLIHPYKIY